jgi:DDE_Tnp_1-associated
MRQLRRFTAGRDPPSTETGAEPPRLLAYLAAAPDPRSALGRRHPLVAILALAAAAVLAAARSFAAIAEWATDAPQPVRTGAGRYVMACLRNLVIGMLSRAGAGQPRRRAAPSRPRPRPAPGHPRHHPTEQPPMNRGHQRPPEP